MYCTALSHCFCFPGLMFSGVVATQVLYSVIALLLFSRLDVFRRGSDPGIVRHYRLASVFQARCLPAWYRPMYCVAFLTCFSFQGSIFAGEVATQALCGTIALLLFSRHDVCRRGSDPGIVRHHCIIVSVFQVRCLQAW